MPGTVTMPDRGTKQPTSIRLSAESKRLLKLLADTDLRSQSAELEFLIQQAAKERGIGGAR